MAYRTTEVMSVGIQIKVYTLCESVQQTHKLLNWTGV